MIAKVHSTKEVGNTKSCSDLVNYLSKENEGKELLDHENFFNSQGDNFTDFQVINSIDKNVKGIPKDEAKFFMVSLNPSQKELKHLAFLATGKEISNVSQMTATEKEKFNQLFKSYANDCMELYAQGFNKGLTKDDILYFGKVEHERIYKPFDIEVKEGRAKAGEIKPGLQTHCHFVISRKDRSMKAKISPLINSKGSFNTLPDGTKVPVGFDREKFKIECETLFDVKYEYQRNNEEYYLNAKANKYTQSVSHEQYQAYVNKMQNLSNFKGQAREDLGTQDAAKLVMLAKGLKDADLKNMSSSVKDMVSNGIGGLNASELNKIPAGQFLNLAKGIAASNPVSIAKEIVKIITSGLEI